MTDNPVGGFSADLEGLVAYDWYQEFRHAATEVGRATYLIEQMLPDCTDDIIRGIAEQFLAQHLPAARP